MGKKIKKRKWVVKAWGWGKPTIHVWVGDSAPGVLDEFDNFSIR